MNTNNTTSYKEVDIEELAKNIHYQICNDCGISESDSTEIATKNIISLFKAALLSKEEVDLQVAFDLWTKDPTNPAQDFFQYLKEHYSLIKKVK